MKRLTLVPALSALAVTLAVSAHAAPLALRSNPRDVAAAKRVVFRITDFPAGWSQIPDNGKETGCFSKPLERNSPTAFVQARRFSSGENGTDAYQTVAAFGSPAGARRALVAATASSVFACYKAQVPGILKAAGLKMESFTGGPLSFDRLGDLVRAFRYKIAVSKGSQKDALFLDYVFVVRGRMVVSSGFTQATTEPDVFVEHAILAKSTSRIPKGAKSS